MEFEDVLEQTIALLQHQGRVSYGALKRRFKLDDAYLEDLKVELIEAQQLARDENGRVLVWAGEMVPTPPLTPAPASQLSQTTQPSPIQAAQAPEGEPTQVARRAPEAERRQLTVMFCDLVDSTTLSSRLDPEDYREVVRAYQETGAAVIQRLGGYIAQYLGDGLLVYFGYPLAHEDDARLAVRAGLGIVEAMRERNGHFERRTGVRFSCHAGHWDRAVAAVLSWPVCRRVWKSRTSQGGACSAGRGPGTGTQNRGALAGGRVASAQGRAPAGAVYGQPGRG
jgi:hypothetical protein